MRELMSRPYRWLLVLGACAVMVVLPGAMSADAQLVVDPTTSWGVQGLQTGTEADGWSSPVFAMERIGNVLYVGGRFTHATDGVQEVEQAGLAAFDATTGAWIPSFRPRIDGAVFALQASPSGRRLFVGGDFDHLDGSNTGPLVALDPTSGTLQRDWRGRVDGYRLVRDFDIDSGWVYVGGGFTSISSGGAKNLGRSAGPFRS